MDDVVTELVVELDDAAARRLVERAHRGGVEPAVLARRILSEANEMDPFEFIGSYESDLVAGREADEFLLHESFGTCR